jgi:ElaB/YqjD/DUF883 family membrane-anchored ribosome-binding protein
MPADKDNTLEGRLDELAGKAKKIAEEASAQLGSLKDSEEFESMKKMASDLGEEAAAVVRRYPLQSVLGAAVAGFLLGSLRRGK